MSYSDTYEGYAAGVTGGGSSPDTTYIVSNLNNTGTGSFRDACENAAAGSRRIEFTVSGDIYVGETNGDILITASDITIAFETAPDQGVQILAHANLTTAPLRIEGNNIDIRYMRSRPAPNDPSVRVNIDSVGINSTADGIMFHHCELMLSSDENADAWDTSKNITFQWCIISHGLDEASHALGMLLGSGATNISVHHCLFAHLRGRTPRLASAGPLDMRNCIIYNALDHPMTSTSVGNINLVSNVLLNGANTTRDYFITSSAGAGGNIYIEDNIQPGAETIRLDAQADFTILSSALITPGVHTVPSEYVVEYVLPYVGAILPMRDSLSQTTINDVANVAGVILDTPSDLAEWPPTLTSAEIEYKITRFNNVPSGANPTLNKMRVQFLYNNDLTHTEDFIVHLNTQRLWDSGIYGPLLDINKRYAIREIIAEFAKNHKSDLLLLPTTTSLSTISTDGADPDGWIADTELSDTINTEQPLS